MEETKFQVQYVQCELSSSEVSILALWGVIFEIRLMLSKLSGIRSGRKKCSHRD